MGLLELFIIAVGLSMDAFAVAICKGLSVRALRPRHAVVTGLYFGGFQSLMPLIGYFLGVRFQSLITSVDCGPARRAPCIWSRGSPSSPRRPGSLA